MQKLEFVAKTIDTPTQGFFVVNNAKEDDMYLPIFEATKEKLEKMSVIKDKVIDLLVKDHAFTVSDAQEAVDESVDKDASIWSENANPEELANFLASDEADD